MKILKETKTYLALISALFLVGCYSELRNQIYDIEEQLVEEDEIAVEEEIQEAEASPEQIWEELAEKDTKK
jgi:cell division protein ZapA (FtsZ GTPase activity inhibitor)